MPRRDDTLQSGHVQKAAFLTLVATVVAALLAAGDALADERTAFWMHLSTQPIFNPILWVMAAMPSKSFIRWGFGPQMPPDVPYAEWSAAREMEALKRLLHPELWQVALVRAIGWLVAQLVALSVLRVGWRLLFS